MPDSPEDPVASVVLVVQDHYRAIARTVAHLAEQTVADRMELVVVTPAGFGELPPDPNRDRIARVTRVGLEGASLGSAQAEGVRAASGPVVILGEDHAWPEPGYVEALAARCRPPYAAVGPVMTNANPWSVVSWSNLLLAYGKWTDPAEGGPIDSLPGTNTAYDRSVLLGLGDELDGLMEREGGLLKRLQKDGHELYLEPAARTAHQNVSGPASGAALRFHAGRLYADRRVKSERWGPGKRALYFLAAPLIPGVRAVRILGELRGKKMPLTPRVVGGVGLGVTLDGLGQMAGYGGGAGKALTRLEDFEFNRYRYLSKRDRAEAGL